MVALTNWPWLPESICSDVPEAEKSTFTNRTVELPEISGGSAPALMVTAAVEGFVIVIELLMSSGPLASLRLIVPPARDGAKLIADPLELAATTASRSENKPSLGV